MEKPSAEKDSRPRPRCPVRVATPKRAELSRAELPDGKELGEFRPPRRFGVPQVVSCIDVSTPSLPSFRFVSSANTLPGRLPSSPPRVRGPVPRERAFRGGPAGGSAGPKKTRAELPSLRRPVQKSPKATGPCGVSRLLPSDAMACRQAPPLPSAGEGSGVRAVRTRARVTFSPNRRRPCALPARSRRDRKWDRRGHHHHPAPSIPAEGRRPRRPPRAAAY